MDEKFGEFVRRRRKSLGLTQGELAGKLQISVDFVSRIEKGERTPSPRTKSSIEDFFAKILDFNDLEAMSESLERGEQGKVFKVVGSESPTADVVAGIPVFHMAGAGPPRLSTGGIVDVISLPSGFYHTGIIPVKVAGHSMEPVILDGAIVGVNVHDKEYRSGKYYAVWIDDEGAVIKKLSSEPGRVFVESLNKSEHSFYVGLDAIRDHFILGRVVWWINKDDTN